MIKYELRVRDKNGIDQIIGYGEDWTFFDQYLKSRGWTLEYEDEGGFYYEHKHTNGTVPAQIRKLNTPYNEGDDNNGNGKLY